jgi:DNA-3-methyladenine glycosylase II
VLLPFFAFTSLLIAVGLAALTPIRGIGLWSAQTLLIHALGRRAVLSAADLGILHAAGRRRFNAPHMPGAVVVRPAVWRPYSSSAAAMLWRPRIPGGKRSDPKARALCAGASRRAAEQEPR